MYTTGLTEKEKESLIKWLCTQGKLVLKHGRHLFEFDGDLNMEDKWNAGHLLEKAFINIENQLRGIK